jgi:hypothetical protein
MELSAAVTEIGKGMTSGPDEEDLFMIIAGNLIGSEALLYPRTNLSLHTTKHLNFLKISPHKMRS